MKPQPVSASTSKLVYILVLISLSALLTIYRAYYLSLEQVNLFADEAQYWDWSKNLAFGYYSKPPMIAWVIRLFSYGCGDGEFCIRLASPIFHLLTSWVIFAIAGKLYNDIKIAFWSALTYLTLPAVILSATIMSTDPLLLFFWALSLYLFILVMSKPDNIFWWLLLALACGMGCLSKYNMVIFGLSALLYVLWSNQVKLKQILANYRFYVALLVAFLIYLPNLLWNIKNHFVSYHHTKDISKLHGPLVHPEKLLEFLGAQVIILGPILFYLFLRLLLSFRSVIVREENSKLLFSFICPFLIIISILSFLSGAYANWAAPIYIALVILSVFYAYKSNRQALLICSLILHVSLGVIFYNYEPIIKKLGIEYTNAGPWYTKDPFKRMRGWQELGEAVTEVTKEYPGVAVIAEERKLIAELSYYVLPHPFKVRKWSMSNEIHDHYELTRRIGVGDLGEDFLLVTASSDITKFKKSFTHIELVKEIKLHLYQDMTSTYYVYYLKDYIR